MKGDPPEGAGAGTGAVVLAFLAGALVGAVGALLLAPRSGAATREALGGAAADAGERARRARDAAHAALAAAGQAFDEAMRRAKPPAA